MLPAMAVALLAGILSFLSPCVLPVVPPYLAYMGGVS
ncbi:MAG: cytochrome c biogenesis protein CcdA, partial [Paracoccaceae bacterium]|nr:cytochrome c biogenesis protein CcdA [Paracoccaceae bacterium]